MLSSRLVSLLGPILRSLSPSTVTCASSTAATSRNKLHNLIRSTYMASAEQPVQLDIVSRLQAAFSPIHLQIENESYKHSVPKGSETHFKVVIVSDKFEGVPLIEQHRMVNQALATNLTSGVHALALKTMTPKKWETLNAINPSATTLETPNCLGGSKHDKQRS